MKKKISIVSGAYNEEANIREFYDRVTAVMKKMPQYDYEIIVADNCSRDRTREIMREIAATDRRFKCIFNSNNFGPDRSTTNARHRAKGDAVVMIVSDLQDPPELIEQFVARWEEGYPMVCAIKRTIGGGWLIAMCRKLYYRLLCKVSVVRQIPDFIGFGLFDRKVVEALKQFHDPEPYVRGLLAEIGFRHYDIAYDQDVRKKGKSSYRFFNYYDYAMVGFVNYTKLPLRLAVFAGFVTGFVSILIAIGYLVYKLCYWNTFQLGLAPLVIGLFFFSAVQLIFIGIIGEYIGAIWTQVKNKPLVIEEETINFDQ